MQAMASLVWFRLGTFLGIAGSSPLVDVED
jgi:hypothetical protein